MLILELSFYLAIFVAAVFAFDVLLDFAGAMRNARMMAANRRARLLNEGAASIDVLRQLTGGRSQAAQQAEQEPVLVRLHRRAEDLLRRSGVNWTVRRFALTVAVVALAFAFALSAFLKLSTVGSLGMGMLLAGGVGWLFLMNRANARKAKMAEQLPDAIDMIVRSLQAGHPIRAALGVVATDTPDPLGSEIGIAVDEMTFGLELEEALENLRERVRLPDLDYLVVAITIHSHTGGNLAEILANLSTVIRGRYTLHKKVRALSAEGRLSAWVIAMVPFVIAVILGLNVPNYYQDAARHSSFWMVSALAIGLYAAAVFSIWRIVRIKV